MIFMEGKGWHQESARHSLARRTGYAGGTKKKPRMIEIKPSGMTPQESWNKRIAARFPEKEERKEFLKERKEHPSFSDKQVKQIVKDHEAEEKEKQSFSSVAEKNVSDKEKADFHRKQILSELRKDKPDYKAIHYHRLESLKYLKKRPVFVPRPMLSKD